MEEMARTEVGRRGGYAVVKIVGRRVDESGKMRGLPRVWYGVELMSGGESMRVVEGFERLRDAVQWLDSVV